ncbi:hypothetical protein KUF54_12520 [Comamonas sp. Y33R10-2]|uniref:hypothetical protein n=1 Tax=Comamonas sp. Y33R10-2 TaxID=2853257 RepID=UPI001C5CA5A3|nr:hypothetical protein [Comamonas sp. Y33R10-2]QXZ08873.1 hypothetical protein KUF54_12520 [Comamonas sp. Y33R10-2]
MTLRKNLYFCPQCGTSGKHLNRASAQTRRCESCGTEFSVSQAAAAAPDAVHFSLPSAGHWGWWVSGALVLAAAAAFAVPLWISLGRSGSPSVESRVNWGRAQESALHEAGGKISRIEIFQRRNEQSQDEYTVVVSDMQSGAHLSEPQVYRLPWMLHGEDFRNLSDGNLYLQLKEKIMLRLDPGAQQFVDITPQLSAQFPRELGSGIAKITFAYKYRPDCFEVLANDGKKYLVYWLIGQIQTEEQARESAQKIASYTELTEDYQFVPLMEGNSLNRNFLLVKTWRKSQSGQPQYSPYFEMAPVGSESFRRGSSYMREVGSGYAVRSYVISEGLTKLQVLEPATPRFNADVLAHNATRLLLSYSPTPDEAQGRVLQLLDRHSGQIVWSRTMAQIPQLAQNRGERYLKAQGIPSGFLMQSTSMEPGHLMDNNGGLVKDFASPPRTR